jgi:aspartate aminotransferase-like enzyme
MLNFTVGPVEMDEKISAIGAEPVPYFRTPEFSLIMKENEQWMKNISFAPCDARVVFLTGSGTAAMEAAVMNCFGMSDKLLVVNGGSFGQRFSEICDIHNIQKEEIKLNYGEALRKEHLAKYEKQGFTAFIVNLHETSTGVLYDLDLISDFCKKNNMFLVVDAISSFLADSINMEESGIGILITGSQKALAVPPGVSILVLSKEAVERVDKTERKCMYLDLKSALKNGERGQTPFTPAVGILRQIHARLKEINSLGVEKETEKIREIAQDFRLKIKELPFEIASESMSNAVTPLHPINASAYKIFEILKDEYNIWVCPNGGELADKIFRVGHMGALTTADNDTLIQALQDMKRRNLL